MATLILTLLPIILNTYRRDILRSPPFHSTQLSILSRTPAIRLKKKAVIKENNACTKLEPREIHHTRLSTYQTSFLNFFKIFSRTFFSYPYLRRLVRPKKNKSTAIDRD